MSERQAFYDRWGSVAKEGVHLNLNPDPMKIAIYDKDGDELALVKEIKLLITLENIICSLIVGEVDDDGMIVPNSDLIFPNVPVLSIKGE